MKEENREYESCSINIANANKKNYQKRDGHNMFLGGRKPGPSMTTTSHAGKIIIPLYD